MTIATAAFIRADIPGFNSNDMSRRDNVIGEFPAEIHVFRNAVEETFLATFNKYSNRVGLLPQKIDKNTELSVYTSFVFPKIENPKSPSEVLQDKVLQDWEGVVETMGDENFTARLRDLTNEENYPSEIAELPIEDISDDDQELLQVGAVFYLTVGRSIRPNGRQQRFGRIVFRRLPGWTSSTLHRAEKRAKRLSRFLNSKD